MKTEEDTSQKIEKDRERLKSLERKYSNESDAFESFIYSKRRSLELAELNSKSADPHLASIYEERHSLLQVMEQDLYEFRDTIKEHLNKEYDKLDEREKKLDKNDKQEKEHY